MWVRSRLEGIPAATAGDIYVCLPKRLLVARDELLRKCCLVELGRALWSAAESEAQSWLHVAPCGMHQLSSQAFAVVCDCFPNSSRTGAFTCGKQDGAF